jgi:endonuclease-3
MPTTRDKASRTSRKTVREVIARLHEAYPDAHIMLEYKDPWQLLVATILSAQSTDVGVNKVTTKLFKKYRTIEDYAAADPAIFEQDIHATGFFRNKTKSVMGAAAKILAEFRGMVPDTMEDLIKLPGVARKTANIVLSNAFGKVEGIAVDTHVFRVSRRLGWSTEKDPNKVERDLLALIPKDEWYAMNYLLIEHGRAICKAPKARCGECMIADLCPSVFGPPAGY